MAQRTTDYGAQSQSAGLRDPNGGFLQEPPLTATALNVLSWSIPDTGDGVLNVRYPACGP